MRFSEQITNAVTLAELGARLRQHRLERNLTQDELAAEAGVGRATLQRLEHGQSVQFGSLLSVLRPLGLLDGLNALVPEPLPSPVEQLKLQKRRRQRARGRRQSDSAAGGWRWGDDVPGAGN